MRHNLFQATLATAIIALGAIFRIPTADALTYQRDNELVVGDRQIVQTLFNGKFRGGASVAVADYTGDGRDDFIVGAYGGGGPQVEIYTQTGRKLPSFFAFPASMTGGVFVAAADIDGDGDIEIAVAPQRDAAPEVRIFSGGKLLRSFLAYERGYRGGVRLALIPARDGQPGKIVTAPGIDREQEVKVFDVQGKKVMATLFPYGKTGSQGIMVAGGWSPTYGEDIVVTAPGHGRAADVVVYGLNTKRVRATWKAYDPKVKVGASVGFANDRIVTGPLGYGGPDVKTFSLNGSTLASYQPFESTFRGGVNVALTTVGQDVLPVTVPNSIPASVVAVQGKRIEIDISKQELRMIQRGRLVSVRRISSGKWSTPTPIGNFKTYNKVPVAYSKPYDLYMEYWMAITPDGSYGLHALPFWKLRGGGKLYEGASHIGRPASHGCIRQTVEDAKSLYSWAPIGTPVKIVQ